MAICPAAVIAECDESLCGTNLTAAERALFTRRRKEAYEALHPETKHETFKGNQHTGSRQVGDNHTERFTADTAAKTGQSERAVQRDAARGKNIAPEVLTQIAGTKLDTGKTLDKLAAVPKGMPINNCFKAVVD
jgi:ParB family transcriptional regulator, chromosome partitioning protein